MTMQNKVREELAKRFTEALAMGKIPWKACWQQTRPTNAVTGTNYKGINAMWLSYLADELGYQDPRWCTFNQVQKKDWHIRKGEKAAAHVEYWAYYDTQQKKLLQWDEVRKLLKADPEYEKNLQLRCRVYPVFNAQQIDGIPELVQNQTDIGQLRQQRDTLIRNMGIQYREIGTEAFYSPQQDCVTLPPEKFFDDTYGYMATFLHECGHATGHSTRLDRPLDGYSQNRESYAQEELRAEIASAFTTQMLGLKLTAEQEKYELQRHMAYVQNWAVEIQEAPEALFHAIRDAEKISDYLIEKGEFQSLLERTGPEQAKEPVYYHYYYQCKYLFTAAGESRAEDVTRQLSTAFNSCGWFWSDSGDVVKSPERRAAPTNYFDADPAEPKIYREATNQRIETHLRQTCYHWKQELHKYDQDLGVSQASARLEALLDHAEKNVPVAERTTTLERSGPKLER